MPNPWEGLDPTLGGRTCLLNVDLLHSHLRSLIGECPSYLESSVNSGVNHRSLTLLVFPVTKWLWYHTCHLHWKNLPSFCCCKHPAVFVSASLSCFDLLPRWHWNNSTLQGGCVCQTQQVWVWLQQASPCREAQPFYHEFLYICKSKRKWKCLTSDSSVLVYWKGASGLDHI